MPVEFNAAGEKVIQARPVTFGGSSLGDQVEMFVLYYSSGRVRFLLRMPGGVKLMDFAQITTSACHPEIMIRKTVIAGFLILNDLDGHDVIGLSNPAKNEGEVGNLRWDN